MSKVKSMDIVEFRYIPKAERDALPDSDFGFVDADRRLFPIVIEEDVMAAARLLGRANITDEEREKTKETIIKIAKKKNFKLPKSWLAEMSEDLFSEISNNVLAFANVDEEFDLKVGEKTYTLKVTNIR